MKNNVKTRRQKARRGLRSLGFALIFPLSLTLLDITLFGSSHLYRTMEKPFWFPRLWALHLSCLGSAFLMGLSAWLVWAEGGFHRHPVAMLLYVCQLGLSLAWDPVVFKAEATRLGMALCIALFGSLVGCSMAFKNVNPIAADLVKPCLGSALLLAVANLKLVYVWRVHNVTHPWVWNQKIVVSRLLDSMYPSLGIFYCINIYICQYWDDDRFCSINTLIYKINPSRLSMQQATVFVDGNCNRSELIGLGLWMGLPLFFKIQRASSTWKLN